MVVKPHSNDEDQRALATLLYRRTEALLDCRLERPSAKLSTVLSEGITLESPLGEAP